MPRTVWSGAISFGLVTVPIKVVSATEDHSIHFHLVHTQDGGRVRNRKVCELEGREVSQAEIGKGYQLTKDVVIPISDDDLRDLPLPTARAIEIVAFVPVDSVDPIRIAEGYYLVADGQVAAKPYALLTKALSRSSRVAVAKYAWSGRERLGLLRVRGDVLVLHAMRWPDEIRDPAELLPDEAAVSDQELTGALALMDTMTRDDLDGPDFTDRYTEALQKIIEAKRENHALPQSEEPEKPGKILDLMAALNQSVAQARESRGEPADVHEMPKRSKKTAARKSPAKKAPAKKAAGRKRGA
ncbi:MULTISPECIES: non-homologous end joining protein Ku [Streptomyces]|uniref:non-homologous end joining protein Ku n=1 Tax=Streptomyces TaxID=1883 RepID=UPI000A35FA7B|nr:Ku protein [Streptomyces recifensis]